MLVLITALSLVIAAAVMINAHRGIADLTGLDPKALAGHGVTLLLAGVVLLCFEIARRIMARLMARPKNRKKRRYREKQSAPPDLDDCPQSPPDPMIPGQRGE